MNLRLPIGRRKIDEKTGKLDESGLMRDLDAGKNYDAKQFALTLKALSRALNDGK